MTKVIVYLGRFAVVIVGYAVATLAASAFLHVLLLGSQGWVPDEIPPVLGKSLMVSIPLTALFVAYFAFFPSVAAMMLAELLGGRGWLLHALGGMAVAAIALGLFWLTAEHALYGPASLETTRFAAFVAGSGIVGGLAYWLVAGRSAGNWQTRTRSPIPSE